MAMAFGSFSCRVLGSRCDLQDRFLLRPLQSLFTSGFSYFLWLLYEFCDDPCIFRGVDLLIIVLDAFFDDFLQFLFEFWSSIREYNQGSQVYFHVVTGWSLLSIFENFVSGYKRLIIYAKIFIICDVSRIDSLGYNNNCISFDGTRRMNINLWIFESFFWNVPKCDY